MSKRTPGTWVKDHLGTRGHVKAIIEDGGRDTPTVGRYDRGHCADSITQEEIQANGHLFAAAPDLLAACQGAMKIVSLWNGRVVPEYHQDYEEMKALEMMQHAFIEAIAKAEGRKLCDKCGDSLTGHEDDSATRCRWCVICTEVTEGESIADRK